jgi:phosphoglycolate phosphatase
MFDFVIFDLDGTLVDSQKDIASAVNSVRQDLGFEPLSIDQVRSFLGSGIKSLIERAVPCGDGKACSGAVDRFKFHYSKCLTDTTKPYEGIVEMLNDLKGVKKAVLSNKTEIFSREILERLGLLKHFIQVWGGDTIGVKKPDPQPILDLIKNSGACAEKAIMIGDSANDFKAAEAAGVACGAVMYGYSAPEQIAEFNPDFLIKEPSEIVRIIL